jgi:aldehyde:ferredoxin oxidoreductase
MARFGYSGRILRVDLTDGSLDVETLDDETWRLYAGGGLLGTRLLFETSRGVDALDPPATLVIASSAVAGHRAAALPRFSVVAKSPLTGGVGEARAEGPFGVALKASGFDAIAVRGASERPVALEIVDGRAAIVDATELWGLDTSVVVDRIRVRLGNCSVAAIGPAGEGLVRFASVVSDRSFAAPRMGLGAVMGSKRLKAVAIAGGMAPAPADSDGLAALTASYAARVDVNPVTRWQHAPPGFGTWVGGAPRGTFSVANFSTADFDATGYSSAGFMERFAWGRDGCPGCPSDCIKGFAPSGDGAAIERARTHREGGLHQEAIAALGPNLGIGDAGVALALNDACLRLGIDPVSLGFTLSFAMECRAGGLLSPADLDGLDLRFGAAREAFAITERIAAREGSGDWLADGTRRAAARLAPEAGRFALAVKGLEMTPFDPRVQAGLALGFATAPFGPRYDVAEHDLDYDDVAPSWPHTLELSAALGISTLMAATAQTPEKAQRYRKLADFWSALDTLLICPFASAPVRILSLEDVAQLVRAITGWDTDTEEVMRWGARRMHLMRLYNVREGIDAAQDGLPGRFFDEPIDDGPWAGQRLDREAFGAMIASYYESMGWDQRGVPTAATSRDTGLEWARHALPLAGEGA